MRVRKKRIISLLLAICMITALFSSVPAFAEDGDALEYLINTTVIKDADIKGTAIRPDAQGLQGKVSDFSQLEPTTQPWLIVNQYKYNAGTINAARLQWAAKQSNIQAGNAYIFFQIKIPAGTYKLDISAADYLYGAGMDVYVIPGNEGKTAASFTEANYKGHIDTYVDKGKGNSFAAKNVSNEVTISGEKDFCYVALRLTSSGYKDNKSQEHIFVDKIIFTPLRAEMTLGLSDGELDYIEVGEEYELAATVKDASGKLIEDAEIDYSVSPSGIVSVEDGKVKALAAGKAEISASVRGGVYGQAVSAKMAVEVVDFTKPLPTLEYVFTYKMITAAPERISFANYINYAKYGEYPESLDLTATAPWSLVATRGSYSGYIDGSYVNFAIDEAQLDADAPLYEKGEPGTVNNGFVLKINVANTGLYTPKLDYNESAYGMQLEMYIFPTDLTGELSAKSLTADSSNKNTAGVSAASKLLTPKSEYYAGTVKTSPTDDMPVYKNMLLREGDYFLFLKPVSGSETMTGTSGKYQVYIKNFTLTKAKPYVALSGAKRVGAGDTVTVTAQVLDVRGKPVTDAAVTFESSDKNVATVDAETGVVTGVNKGTAKIIASAELDGEVYTGETEIDVYTVEFDRIEVEALSIEYTDADKTAQISLQAYYTNGEEFPLRDAYIEYKSKTPSVAAVDENGTVTALSAGKGIVEVAAVAGDIAKTCEAEIIVTDNSEIASVEVSGAASVGYLRDTQLTLTVNFADGRTLDIKGDTGTYYPGASVQWEIPEESTQGSVTVDENGLLFGKVAGATAKIGAVLTVGEQTVRTVDGFEITVEESGDNDPRSFGYDLYATEAGGAKFVDIDVDGWKPDIAASSSQARFLLNAGGILAQTNKAGQQLVFKVKVPYSGLYDFSISGRAYGSKGAERVGIFVDGRYVGEYSYYLNALTRDLVAKSLSAIELDAGIHEITTVTYPNEGLAESYHQMMRTLYFTAEATSFGMTGITVEDEAFCLTVGESANPYARMMTDEGFIYAWSEENDSLLDISYTVSASAAADGSDAAVVSVDRKGNIKALANGSAEVTVRAARKDGSESFEKVIAVTVADVAGKLENVRSTYYTGEEVALVLSYRKADGSAVTTAPTAVWSSSDTGVISFNGATLTAKSAGNAVITATDNTSGKVLYQNTVEVLEDYYGIVEISGEPSLTLRPGREATLSAVAKTMAGKALDMTDAEVVWSIDEEYADIASVTPDGKLTAVAEGTAYVTATVTLSDGREAAGVAEISVREGKTSRTYYTDKKVAAARENSAKYAWAKSEVKAAVKAADKYLGYSMDYLWNMIPGEGLPRSWQVGIKGDPDKYICRYCGSDIKASNGAYPWLTDPFGRPWKVQCPDCKRLFPSNDFASFYKLGLDPQTGVFSRDLALENHLEMFGGTYGYGYLKNDLYPELRETGLDPRTKQTITHGWGKLPKEPVNIADVWGVDDGYGYETGRVTEDGVREAHTYIAFYNHFGLWYQSGTHNTAANYKAITELATAYVYTGEEKYGKLAAVMLDRLADVYPDYKAYKAMELGAELGSTSYGKILNNIWEAQIGKYYMYAYDAIFPMYENEEVQRFLQEKAEQYPAIADKSSANAIRDNIENNYIYEMYKSATEREVRGNFGHHHSTIGAAAVVLDRQPDSTEMLDWLFTTSILTENAATGADIETTLIDQVTRDGQGTESPAYNRTWLQDLAKLANVLSDYERNNGYSLWDHPKYIEMARVYNKLTLVRRGVASIGDSGLAGGFAAFPDDGTTIFDAFKYTKDNEETKHAAIELAQRIYHLQTLSGENLAGIHYDIFTRDPESIRDEVLDIIEQYGEYDYDKSSILTGYGFAALRNGALYNTVGTNQISDTTRDFWMYFGGQLSHSHNDMLNLGVEAYGLTLAPENGYPEGTSATPSRGQWTSTTLAHNTVVVDEKSQLKPAKAGDPLHFDAKDTRVKVMDVDVPEVYEETKEYRRTVVMIDYDSDISYGIDFFKILGGDDHLYSFHAASEVIGDYSDNIDLYVQPTGSYAGIDVPFGDDPWTDLSNQYARLKYPNGYTWLFDVRRADNPGISENEPFYADFDIIDFNKHSRNSANMDINLRLTMINDFAPDEITFAKGYPPRTEKNLANIDYYEHMLVRRKGSNLNTLFTTVIEPYNGSRYIKNISRVAMIPGEDVGTDKYAAVKVELCDGRVDYVMYAQNNDVTYTVKDGDYEFDFRGFVGVWTIDTDKNNLYSYINDGSVIGDVTDAVPSVTGTIRDFTKEPAFENYIDVEFESAVANADILKECIIIAEHSGNGNATYFIENAELSEDGLSARLCLGGVTPISGHKDKYNTELGYTYDIAEETRFVIPLSYENDGSPVFDAVSNSITTSAGSSVSVKVNATASENGGRMAYSARTLPRGASFDAGTGTLRWKPDASQVGENLVGINATDELGRTSTIYFTVTVYGSTTGSTSNATQDSSGMSSEGTGTSGGGGGGGGVISDAEGDKENDTPDTGDETQAGGAPDASGETDDIRFTDLGNHGWAEDAINTLAEDGIIKGTSASTFSPGANITRADFALLLVRAFGLTSDNTENFADVVASDYFAPELATARNTGIVNGIGDNKFAPRNHITRQDMLVIVYRAMQKLGIGFGENIEPQHPDFDTVAPYARDAVSALISAGLVNGKSGYIAPADNTTRAEVAVLIKRILDYSK